MERNARPRILVILSSIREGRAGEPIARWAFDIAAKRDDAEFEFVDLKDWPLPMYAHAKSPKQFETLYTEPMQKAWVEKVGSADGFLIVTPEYNHGYPPTLKNLLDYVYKGWNNKPVGFVAYGNQGGTRSVEQLRTVAVELQMAPIRDAVHIKLSRTPFADEAAKDPVLQSVAQNTLNQLVWWAQALKSAREQFPLPLPVTPPKP